MKTETLFQQLRWSLRVMILALLGFAPTANAVTLVVTNPASLGPGTLRQALSDNQSLGGGNTIVFSNNVIGTITLQGELSVNSPVTIRGPGADVLAISGNQLSRIFSVTAGPTFISDLTIRNGRVAGSDGNQMQNGDDASAGGILNLSSLTLSNCVVLSNSVFGGNGGPSAQGTVGRGGKAYGGGIYNQGGSLWLITCSLIGNRAQGGAGGNASGGGGGGGGGSNVGPGGDGFGGGVASVSAATQIMGCDFSNNQVGGGAGGIAQSGNPGGSGGPAYGAGFYNEGPANIGNSTFRSGRAIGGDTTGGPGSSQGGGIASISTLGLTSCTIVSNTASGTSNFDFGGGIFNGGDLGITNSTIAFNQADSGGGWYGSGFAANTLVAHNLAGTDPDVSGVINSLDYNLIQNSAGATLLGLTTHVITGQDPLLGPLQNNGAPTLTMALLPGSPAIDQGKNFGIAFDQRGITRPFNLPSVTNAGGGDGSDIGAYEFLPVPQLNIQRGATEDVVLSWSSDATDYHLECVTNLPPADSWLEVTNQRVFVGDQTYVTNAATGSVKFYRLRFP